MHRFWDLLSYSSLMYQLCIFFVSFASVLFPSFWTVLSRIVMGFQSVFTQILTCHPFKILLSETELYLITSQARYACLVTGRLQVVRISSKLDSSDSYSPCVIEGHSMCLFFFFLILALEKANGCSVSLDPTPSLN